jgi:transcriptional regulator with XRE-family HTH domain
MNKETLGMRLKRARDLMRLSQLEVEEQTGINNANLSRYEKDTTSPNLDTLKILANFYKVSLDWLFGVTDKPNRVTSDELKEYGIEWVELRKDAVAAGLSADDVREIINLHLNIAKNNRKK